MGRSRRFLCDECDHREYEVIVEPSREGTEISGEEMEWLDNAEQYCPACGNTVTEV